MEKLIQGVLSGDRAQLAKAITLVESDAPDHEALAQQILKELKPHVKKAMRIGISGPPGVGKSTLIEALGLRLIELGHKVAVLAVDPSSPVSKGSILGDRTRMPKLSQDLRAYIRPSPSKGMLGGVAPKTREVMQLVEAAGFDVVMVETVGVGQSEVSVAAMVDTFVLLISPASGDELQGAKKGVLELANVIAITKWDGDLKTRAESTRHAYMHALSTGRSLKSGVWRVPVQLISALTGDGVDVLWQKILDHHAHALAHPDAHGSQT